MKTPQILILPVVVKVLYDENNKTVYRHFFVCTDAKTPGRIIARIDLVNAMGVSICPTGTLHVPPERPLHKIFFVDAPQMAHGFSYHTKTLTQTRRSTILAGTFDRTKLEDLRVLQENI